MNVQNSAEEKSPLISEQKEERDKKEIPFDNGKGGIVSTSFTLSNAAIGSGVLAFSFAYSQVGLLTSIVLTLLLVVITGVSLHVLAYFVHSSKAMSYQDIISFHCGPIWGKLTSFLLFFYLTGALIAYFVVIGDMGTSVVQKLVIGHETDHPIWYCSRPVVMVIFSFLLILPLCLLKRVEFLGFAAFFAVTSCSYVSIFLSFRGIQDMFFSNSGISPGVELDRWIWGFFQTLPLITFALTCHASMPPIYAGMKSHSVKRFDLSVVFAMILCTLLYVPAGFFGYLLFGQDTKGDILCNFPVTDIAGTIGRGAVTLAVTLSFPINNFPCRLAAISLFVPGGKVTNFRLYLSTILIFIGTLSIAILIPELQDIFSVLGATFGVTLVYLFPALLLVLKRRDSIVLGYLLPILFLFMAIIIGVAGTADTIYSMIQGKGTGC